MNVFTDALFNMVCYGQYSFYFNTNKYKIQNRWDAANIGYCGCTLKCQYMKMSISCQYMKTLSFFYSSSILMDYKMFLHRSTSNVSSSFLLYCETFGFTCKMTFYKKGNVAKTRLPIFNPTTHLGRLCWNAHAKARPWRG